MKSNHYAQLVFVMLLLSASIAVAQTTTVRGSSVTPAQTKPRGTLPTDHAYQVELRKYLATLTEKDFEHGVTEPLKAMPADPNPEVNYRNYVLTLMQQPLVGTKRGAPAVSAPARLFLLSSIEHPDGVLSPPVWPEGLASLVNWNYPGNPYFGNRGLKLRAFVRCATHLMMLEDHLENHPDRGGARTDWLGGHLILVAFPYVAFQDVLPASARAAFQDGVRRLAERALDWGPEGEEPNLETVTVAGLWHAGQVISEPAFSQRVEAFAKRHFTDPRSFHPAGFFLDHQGIDLGYQGTANFMTAWIALASRWPFAQDALDRAYRLRAHLLLPEPDGKFFGPSHFSSRTSNDAARDQWEWGIGRDYAASLVTPEALHLVKMPDEATVAKAGAFRASAYNGQIKENPVRRDGPGYVANEDLRNNPWAWRMWQSFNYPVNLNPGYEFYPDGAYARNKKLVDDKSPLLVSPYLRGETFVRNFADAFVCARQANYAALVHTGPIGGQGVDDGLHQFHGPLGFGGGQLSAFWTPATGSVILGRRGGNTWDKTFDLVENWRNWPLHAVSGVKANEKVFTSARIRQPEVTSDNNGTVTTRGVLPPSQLGQGKVLEGRLTLTRTFRLTANEVAVESTLHSTGQDLLQELYETIPVFLHEAKAQAKSAPTAIAFRVNNEWQPATTDAVEATAVRLTRFEGQAVITLDRPRRIKLSPETWTDTYLSAAKCQTLLIDLLDGAASPKNVRGEIKIAYRIAGVAGAE